MAYVIVGMSGGVDSSVTALLLKQQGHRVAGLFMKNWEEDDTEEHCSASADVADAQAVCDKLGIPLYTANFAAEYWDEVFTHFLQEYRAGRTPNPDILCNKNIKFKAFLDYALQLGADFIATGHYARIQQADDAFHLLKGIDSNKDQSYFLYTLNQMQLSRSLFPIGELTKPEVRTLAKQTGFTNQAKKDSTGICFIGERKFKSFLSEYLPAQPGDMLTVDGKVIGKHDGLMYYTIGQRQGLHIGGSKTGSGEPWYVVDKDISTNRLIVAQGHDHPTLFAQSLTCQDLHWIGRNLPTAPLNCTAKTRYRQSDQACQLIPLTPGQYQVNFEQPQWAITPGQSVVFYQNEECLGGGVIVDKG
jgi:tRNA-specific 2-thiouridylase